MLKYNKSNKQHNIDNNMILFCFSFLFSYYWYNRYNLLTLTQSNDNIQSNTLANIETNVKVNTCVLFLVIGIANMYYYAQNSNIYNLSILNVIKIYFKSLLKSKALSK